MENLLICRLCLKVTNDQMWKLFDECEILRLIRSCLSLDVPIDKALPNQLCKECINKIEEINKFSITVKENQQKLQQHLENGSLNDYYTRLTNVKLENNGQGFFSEDLIKYEDTKIKSKLISNINTENSINDILNESEDLKEDVNDYETAFTSEEDNITLSSLKQEKEYEKKKPARKKKDVVLKTSKENLIEHLNCLTCDEICESQDKLREHYKVSHSKKTNDVIEPSYTESIVNSQTMYKCEKCDKMYAKKYIKRHMNSHSNERPYVCKICARTYKTVSDIMRHGFRAHSGLKLLCAFKCGFSTAYSGALKEHEDKIHKNKYKYTCDKCGKGFTVKTWFDQHQNIHTGLKPFICDVCGVAFHMDKYLTSHRSTMHPQSLPKKPLICLHCDLKCDSVNTLALHLEKEHGIARSKNEKKKTLCDFCGKILNRPEQLLFHRRMHLGEKPYKCSICNKAFPRKFSLRVHERAHIRARTHACATCGKLYSQPSAMYRHQRLHHGLARKRAW